MSNWHFIGDFTLGAVLLLICSIARLGSPQTDRSYTTLFRFCIAAAYYSAVYLGTYALLVGFTSFARHVLAGVAQEIVAELSDIPGWIALLILLISCIPPLSAWDRSLRWHVQRIGGIPSEAIKLRDSILHAQYEIGDSDVYYAVLRRGVDLGNMQALPDHTLYGLLKRAAQLRYILEQCRQMDCFKGFFADNSRRTRELSRRFDDLLFKTSRAFATLGRLSGLVDRTSGIPDTWDSLGSVVQTEVYTGSTALLDPTISASRVLQSFLREDARAYRSDTALLLARLALRSGATEGRRITLLHSIGIMAQQQVRPHYQVLLTSFAIVAVLLCIGTAIFGANDAAGVGEVVGTILMVATTLVTSLLCAVYPKQHFAFANVNAFGRLPYRFFAVAGLTAAAAAFVIGLALRMLIYQDAEKALLLAYQRSPFLLVSCTFAVLMALLVQDTDELASATRRTAHRWRDTYVLALGGTAAGAAATLLLRYTDPNKPVSVWAGAFVGLIGGTLGYLVPHRFRNVCPQPHPGRAGIPEIEPEKITEPVVSASTPSSSASTETLRSH